MDYNTSNAKVLGIIFDVSLRHQHGRRIIDNIKQAVICYLQNVFEDDDVFYLYCPENTDTLDTVGQQVAAVSNYELDGWQFDLFAALKQTLYILGLEYHYKKKILLITDRISNVEPIRKIHKIGIKDHIDCEVIILSVGNYVDFKQLEQRDISLHHVENSLDLYEKLKEFTWT